VKINVYGAGLSACVAAASLAKVGNDVMLYGASLGDDAGGMSTVLDEYGLQELIQVQMDQGRLNTCALEESSSAQVHWLALAPVEQHLAESIIHQLVEKGVEDALIINQCNFGVGSTNRLKTLLGKHGDVVYIPDNLQEGRALDGFNNPTRLIIGLDEGGDLVRVKSVLRPFITNLSAMQLMTSAEAEFTKFATTGMLALRLGYMNELASLAEKSGVDISIVQEGMGLDSRIGPNYLSPGCGFGGQNFQAYLSAFTETFQKDQLSLLQTVVKENEKQKELLFRQFWQFYKGDLEGRAVALWGVAFKPGTASIDHAPSIKIINALISQGVAVHVHDPEALKNIRALFADEALVVCHDDHMQAVEGVDALMLATEWPLYWSPDYSMLLGSMRTPLVIDGRNIFDKDAMKNNGFHYIGVGR
jgi:UDPglucose 6-dehydrogenase